MITRSYDVIVAGFRPGGLLAGALLAKRGLRVLVLHQDYAGPVERGRHLFPSHRYPFMGLEHPDFLGAAFDQLTIHPNERRALKPLVPGFQVILPRQRVDVYADDRLKAELSREFREEAVLLEAFYTRAKEEAEILSELWQDRRVRVPTPTLLQKVGLGNMAGKDKGLFLNRPVTVGDLYAELEASPALRAFFNVQLMAFGYVTAPEHLPMSVAGHILTAARSGLIGDLEQVEPLQELLLERIQSLHSDVMPKRLERLEFSWGRCSSFYFEGDSQKSSCEYLLWNTAWDGLIPLLPESVARKGYTSRGVLPSQLRFTVHVVLDDFVIPVGMQENALVVGNLEEPFSDGNVLHVSISPEGSERFAPLGVRAVTLSTWVSAAKPPETTEACRALTTKMMTLLKKVMPFLDEYIKEVHVPTGAELGETWFDAGQVGRQYPLDLGPGPRLPHWNLFHLGRETFPLLGVDGELGAGMMTEQAITALVTRKA